MFSGFPIDTNIVLKKDSIHTFELNMSGIIWITEGEVTRTLENGIYPPIVRVLNVEIKFSPLSIGDVIVTTQLLKDTTYNGLQQYILMIFRNNLNRSDTQIRNYQAGDIKYATIPEMLKDVKWIAIAAAVIAGVYLLTPIVKTATALIPNRRT